jgi:hypothetical protein
MESIRNQIQTRSSYFKNPLEIFALFIALIHGSASTYGILSKNLSEAQVWSIIMFLIFFPIIVFFTFIYVLIKHPENFYSPGDYGSGDIFLTAVSKKGMDEMIEEKVSEDKAEKSEEFKIDDTVKKIPDQKTQWIDKFYLEQDSNRLFQYFLDIEEATLKQLDQLYPSLNANVAVHGRGYHKQFDAIFTGKKEHILFEIKIYRKKISPPTIKLISQRFMNKVYTYQQITQRGVKAIIVIVSDFNRIDKTGKYKEYLKKMFSESFAEESYEFSIIYMDLHDIIL